MIPLFFALQKLGDVQAIVVEPAKFLASFFFVPVLVGLNWRRGTGTGAMASILGGFVACLAWELTGQAGFTVPGIDAVEVGAATSLALFVSVSWVTRPVPEDYLRLFFKPRETGDLSGSDVADPGPPTPPERIGPYRIEGQLGAGAMGEVYRAYDERLDRRVALKQIRPERAGRSRARQRFLREARMAAQLNHPFLVQVHDIVETEAEDWIVMELVRGEPLSRLLKDGPLEPRRGLALAIDIATGLAAAHDQGILHRDLKSENVVVAPEGHPKILDFGLAKPLGSDSEGISLTDGLVGTPRALSPEQAQGQELDQRSDLFSLGVLFYEMFTATSPFLGQGLTETLAKVCHHDQEPMDSLVADLPEGLSRLVDQLLEKDPAQRPESAGTVVAVCKEIRAKLDAPPAELSPGTATSGSRVEAAATASGAVSAKPETSAAGPFYLGGERRQVSLVCCDLVAGADPSASLDPEALYAILPQFQALAAAAVEELQGHLVDFQGHRLVVCFGYPLAHEDDAGRAVLAGLHLVARTRELVARVGLTDVAEGAIRAAVHTGPAVVWTGPAGRLSGTAGQGERVALGETLDLATAIQDLVAPGTVVVSPTTHRLIAHAFACEAGPSFPGTVDETTWTVHGVLPPEQRERAGALSLVGREEELSVLIDRFARVRDGTGQVVLVSGEAGMGKSRLLEVLRHTLGRETSQPRWIAAWESPYPGTPAGDFPRRLLRHLLDLPTDTPQEAQLARLEAVLEEHEFPLAETEPPLAALLGAAPQGAGDRSEPSRDALEALWALVFETAERRPLVLVFEDLQSLDPTSLKLVGSLMSQAEAVPLLLVLTFAPGFQAPWPHPVHATQLHLSPLTEREVEALINRHSGENELPPEQRTHIVARADGVPLFATELVRHTLRARFLERDPGIPATLRDRLTARLDRLGPAKELALTVAALGREFPHSEAAALSPLDAAQLRRELDRLVAAQLLVRQGDTYRFQYALLHEAAYASLLEEDKEKLRRRIAQLRHG